MNSYTLLINQFCQLEYYLFIWLLLHITMNVFHENSVIKIDTHTHTKWGQQHFYRFYGKSIFWIQWKFLVFGEANNCKEEKSM